MSNSASRYFETEVLTAPPQRLRLMLIERAIGMAQATLEAWREARWDEALESNIRCRDLITELLAGLDPAASPTARDVAGIYSFLFVSVTEAAAQHDEVKLLNVIRILEIERETWRQVCEQDNSNMGATTASAAVYTPAPVISPPFAGG